MNRAVPATMVVALCLVVMSCASSRRVVYLQEKSVEIPESSVAFDARIMREDIDSHRYIITLNLNDTNMVELYTQKGFVNHTGFGIGWSVESYFHIGKRVQYV